MDFPFIDGQLLQVNKVAGQSASKLFVRLSRSNYYRGNCFGQKLTVYITKRNAEYNEITVS